VGRALPSVGQANRCRYQSAPHLRPSGSARTLAVGRKRRDTEGAAANERAIGHPPVRVFRFPYGSSSVSALAVVNRLGYTAVGRTTDTLGWKGTRSRSRWRR
jgi:peptidoglycan/xylan/chitin deacetylase (PgdA/CDA1 family)